LNGDGELDVVVAIPSGNGLATILLGDGAGNFAVSELEPSVFANKGQHG
jgi:hypothetical protein